jgi:hypothetical protein
MLTFVEEQPSPDLVSFQDQGVTETDAVIIGSPDRFSGPHDSKEVHIAFTLNSKRCSLGSYLSREYILMEFPTKMAFNAPRASAAITIKSSHGTQRPELKPKELSPGFALLHLFNFRGFNLENRRSNILSKFQS